VRKKQPRKFTWQESLKKEVVGRGKYISVLVSNLNKSTAGAEGDLLEPCLMAQSDKGDKSAPQTWGCLNTALPTAPSSLGYPWKYCCSDQFLLCWEHPQHLHRDPKENIFQRRFPLLQW